MNSSQPSPHSPPLISQPAPRPSRPTPRTFPKYILVDLSDQLIRHLPIYDHYPIKIAASKCRAPCLLEGKKRKRNEDGRTIGVIFVVSQIPCDDAEFNLIMPMVYRFIDQDGIHPDNFRVGIPPANQSRFSWLHCSDIYGAVLFPHRTLSVLPSLLDRDLSPQQFVEQLYFLTVDFGPILDLLLTYDNLSLPQLRDGAMIPWFLDHGCQIEDLIAKDFNFALVSFSTSLRMVDAEFNFEVPLDKNSASPLAIIQKYNPGLANVIVARRKDRPVRIREELNPFLIQPLVALCLTYSKLS
jgi:hypothetical protein